MGSPTDKERGSVIEGLKAGTVLKLVHAMNMAARKLVSYPDGHPFVIESFEKVETLLNEVFAHRGQLILGIAKDTVMVGSKILDEKDPMLQSFSGPLFNHGIVGITLIRGLATKELVDFNRIVARKRNDVNHEGGINALLTKAGINHIKLQLIDYRLFQGQDMETREEEICEPQTQSFWERFIQGIFEETPGTRETILNGQLNEIEPEGLAGLFNEKRHQGAAGSSEADSRFEMVMRHVRFSDLADDKESQERLFKFIGALHDDLKKRFLEGFFTALPGEDDTVETILAGFPLEIIMKALEKHANKEIYVPPDILKVLQRLKKEAAYSDREGIQGLTESFTKEEMIERLEVIFREDEAHRFVPLDYQKALSLVIDKEDMPATEMSEMQQMEQTLTERGVQTGFLAVLVEMIALYGNGIIPYHLKKSLLDSAITLASRGDLHVLFNLLETIHKRMASKEQGEAAGLPETVTEVFSDSAFISEVLDACVQWGKEKQFHIKRIVERVGEPFATPLMDRLAEEQDKTLRLFYLDLLKEIGLPAKNPALERLADRRWYFLRNLLIILRNLNDPSVVGSVQKLTGYPHPRVKQELLRTLITFNDPAADAMLLVEMDSPDLDRQLQAITLAGMTRNKDVVEKLIGFLKKKGLSKDDYEVKKASVSAMAEMGDTSVFPVFQKILASFSLFARRRLQLLKVDIVASLGQYEPVEAMPLLKKLAGKGSGEIALEAARVLRTIGAVNRERT